MKKEIIIILITFLAMACNNHSSTEDTGYEFLKPGAIQPTGWLEKAIITEVNGVTGHLDEFTPEVGRQPFIDKDTRDVDPKRHWWDGESTGNWIDGLMYLSALTDDPEINKKASTWVKNMLQEQQNDKEPYIGLYPASDTLVGRWNDVVGELWPQSRAYLALIKYYKITGDTSVLNAVKKAAELTILHFQKERDDLSQKKADGTNTHALMIVEPMLELYAITGDRKFLDFSEYIYEKLKYHNQLLLDKKLYLHGVHITENVRIPALIYAFNKKPEYLETAKKGFQLIEENYLNAVGAIRSDEATAYACPNRATEYCAITEWMISCIEMARITGNMHYADMAEKCFFNAAQGARLPNGKGIQYLSYPNQLYTEGQVDYRPNHYPLCCNPNAARIYPYYIGSSFIQKQGGELLAMLYGPGKLSVEMKKNHFVEIEQKMAYPFKENVEFEIKQEKAIHFPFHFRVPGWCKNPGLLVNGEHIETAVKDGLMTIERTWMPDDIVTLQLPMEISVDYQNTELVSIQYGPLVYALKVPAQKQVYDSAAPGFPKIQYSMDDNAQWNYALKFDYLPAEKGQWPPSIPFDQVDVKKSFQIQHIDIPKNSNPWEYPHAVITCKAQKYDAWQTAYDGLTGNANFRRVHLLKQPEIPPIRALYHFLFEKEKIDTLELVPFGTTRLRIVSFPYILRK